MPRTVSDNKTQFTIVQSQKLCSCPPDEGLVVKVPDGNVPITAAGETHLSVGADGKCVAGRRRGGQFGFDAGCLRGKIPDGQSAGLPSNNKSAAVGQQFTGADVVVPVL